MSQLVISPLTWDSQHLGFDCGSISFASYPADSNQKKLYRELSELLFQANETLIVVKLPAAFHTLLFFLGKGNATFIDSELLFCHGYHPALVPCNQEEGSGCQEDFVRICDPTPFEVLADKMVFSRYHVDWRISGGKARSLWVDSIRNHCRGRADKLAVAHVNGAPAGLITLQQNQAGGYSLHIVGVLPEYQGRGVGSQLLQEVISHFGADGPLRVEASTRNDGAVRFYQQNGFRLESISYVIHIWKVNE